MALRRRVCDGFKKPIAAVSIKISTGSAYFEASNQNGLAMGQSLSATSPTHQII
jgi:hypothetical protein